MKKSIFLFFAAILCATSAWGAETYRYSGEKDNWAGTQMTASTDGYYAYYGPVSGAHQFKIGDSSNQWAYNHSYVSKGFNNTDIEDIGDFNQDNAFCWSNINHYILVYYPSTTINTSNTVKICASTFLPNDAASEPEPVADVTVHFINTPNWAAVACHHWVEGGPGTSWPGDVLIKTDEIAGYDVYTATFTGEHTSCIFNNNGNGIQTGSLTVEDGKYYAFSTQTWYDTPEAAEAALATPVEDVYTVVGSPALCGSDWDVTDTSNDMTLVDGLYVWTKENVTLTGNATFKIVKNHNYGQGEWPYGYGQNATIDISTSDCTEGGTYSIKITFDPTTGTITPTIESCAAAEEPIVHTYTVVGQAVLCESDWNGSDATNDMTLTDGKYVWTKENVELRSNAEFRIVKDHAYDEAYPNGGNYVIDLANYAGAAIYNVTITFNAETKEITVAMDKTSDVTPSVISYVLMGVNDDWTNGIPLTVNPNNADEYVLTDQVIIKATDAVKVVTLEDGIATAWCGNVDAYSNATNTPDASGNIVLEDGIYTFYFKKTANNIYINQTGYARNVTNTYGTICLPYASASTAGATFFEVVGKEDGNKVYLASVTELEAGVPYIFEKSANQIKVVYTGDKKDEPVNTGANGLIGNFTNEYVVPANNYILYNNAFIPADGTTNKVNAYRAYLNMDAVQGGKPTQTMPGRRYIGMSVQGENETTGVEDLFTTDAPVKVIENGQFIIIRDGVKYNVQGQKL